MDSLVEFLDLENLIPSCGVFLDFSKEGVEEEGASTSSLRSISSWTSVSCFW